MTSRSVLAKLLAILLPVGIVACGLWALDRYEPPPPEFQLAAQNKVRRAADGVLILGNSLAKRNIRTGQLGRELGLEDPPVSLTQDNTGGPMWYALVKNRLARSKTRPRLVLIVSDLTSLLLGEPRSDENHRLLMAEIDADDEEVLAKVYRGSSFRWLRLRQRRTELRDWGLDALRSLGVGLVFEPALGRRVVVRGSTLASSATKQVFAEENLNFSLHNRVIPVVESGSAMQATAGLKVEEGLLAELLALAEREKIRLVFVRPPLSPINQRDVHPPELEREVAALFNAHRQGYLDLRGIDLRERHFMDPIHMSPEGSRLFTAALADELRRIDALGDRPLEATRLPLVPRDVRREGQPPPLPQIGRAEPVADCVYTAPVSGLDALSEARLAALGLPGASPLVVSLAGEPLVPESGELVGCMGAGRLEVGRVRVSPEVDELPKRLGLVHRAAVPLEAGGRKLYWVYPGTELVLDFAEGWQADRARFAVRVVAESFGGGVAPSVSIGEESWELPGERRHKAELVPPVPEGPWQIRIRSPEGGPYLLVQGIVVGKGLGRSLVLGTPSDNFGAAARLLGGLRGLQARPEYPRAPMALGLQPKLRAGPQGTGVFVVPKLAYLSDPQTAQRSPYPQRCSPVVVAERGVPLPLHNRSCSEVANLGHGRVCHDNDKIVFSTTGGAPVGPGQRRYELGLKPDRQCVRTWWLYPSDVVRLRPEAGVLLDFRDGISKVEVELLPYTEHEEPLVFSARLLVEGRAVLSELVGIEEGGVQVLSWLLDERVPPGTTDVVLELENRSPDQFVQLTMAALSEHTDLTETPRRVRKQQGEVSVVRLGEPPALPGKQRFVRLNTPCGYRIRFGMAHISDNVLHELGLGRGSPVMLYEDGQPLKPHASLQETSQECAGAFGHTGAFLWFSPTQDPEAGVKRSYEHRLVEDVPWRRAVGPPVYWVYPGTSLAFTLPAREGEGPAQLEVTLWALRDERGTDAGRFPVLELMGREARADRDLWTWEGKATTGDEPLAFTVAVPEDGPYTVVHQVVLDGVPLLGAPPRPEEPF